MAGGRKTDKFRLKEKRGIGHNCNYTSWIKTHEIPSRGRSHRLFGGEANRIHQLLSDLEFKFFLVINWCHDVIEIQEQKPLLLDETKEIAKFIGVKHPQKPFGKNEDHIMSSDFLVYFRNNERKVFTCKYTNELTKRVMEKFSIEKEYWRIRNVQYFVVTERQIPETLARNLKRIYSNLFWSKKMKMSDLKILELRKMFMEIYTNQNNHIEKTIEIFALKNNFTLPQTRGFFEYMILKHMVYVDLISKDFSYWKLELSFKKV